MCNTVKNSTHYGAGLICGGMNHPVNYAIPFKRLHHENLGQFGSYATHCTGDICSYLLTHCGLETQFPPLQKTFSHVFSRNMKHQGKRNITATLVQDTGVAELATSHYMYLDQILPSLLMHIYV